MTVTIKDIAKLANIDASSVSRTLRNDPWAQKLKPETRQRILDIAKELGYKRNILAAQTRTGKVMTVAVIGRFDEEFYEASEGLVLSGILQETSANGYGIKVFADSDLHSVFEEISGSRVQYVISLSVDEVIRSKTAEYCKRDNLDLVYVYEHAHAGFPAVTLDNREAACRAVTYLISQGHTRIGLLCAAHIFHYQEERHAGYMEAMRRAGLSINPAWVYCNDDPDYSVRKMLSLPPQERPTAIFGISDTYVVQAQYIALRMGLRVPEDLSTFGFGDSEVGANAYSPLATMHENFAERGKLAVRLLLGQKLEIEPDSDNNYKIKSAIILRDSVRKTN